MCRLPSSCCECPGIDRSIGQVHNMLCQQADLRTFQTGPLLRKAVLWSLDVFKITSLSGIVVSYLALRFVPVLQAVSNNKTVLDFSLPPSLRI